MTETTYGMATVYLYRAEPISKLTPDEREVDVIELYLDATERAMRADIRDANLECAQVGKTCRDIADKFGIKEIEVRNGQRLAWFVVENSKPVSEQTEAAFRKGLGGNGK